MTTPPAWCDHGHGCHDGAVPSRASAPEASRAWLLIEHDGPWAAEAVDTNLPGELGKVALAADELGIRVQLVRRPAREDRGGAGRVFAAWTAGPAPWLADVTGGVDLEALAAGVFTGAPAAGVFAGVRVERMSLVCTHGRRDRCCARYGGPLARALDADYPGEVWETTHVGGHRFAANLVLLPHGLYYGPCDLPTARAAIGAYSRGTVLPRRYRGRAGQPRADQEADYDKLAALDGYTL